MINLPYKKYENEPHLMTHIAKIKLYTSDHEKGNINDNEYKILMEDMNNIIEMENLKSSVEKKATAQNVIDITAKILKNLAKTMI